MRVLVIVTLIAVILPAGASAQHTLGARIPGSEEEIGIGLAPNFRFGRYAVQLNYAFTVIYDDPYNGDIENVSSLGILAFAPYFLFLPFLHTHGDPVPRPVIVVLVTYAALTAVLDSQHHLVFYERPGNDEGKKSQALSVFAGPRAEAYALRDVQWGRYSIMSGIRYARWGPRSPSGMLGDHGFGVEAGVEFPWDIVGGDWHDQDPLLFGAIVFWGE